MAKYRHGDAYCLSWLVFHGHFVAIRMANTFVRIILQSVPWSVTSFIVALIALSLAGAYLFALASCLYMVVIGYWSESMNTLVFISVPIFFGFGFAIFALVALKG